MTVRSISIASETYECDVLVVGSGAAGLTAAVTAGLNGLKVLVVEKNTKFGGTTATSGGVLWIPCNPTAARQQIKDTVADARRYLRHCGEKYGAQVNYGGIDMFLANGPKMMAFLEANTRVRFAGAVSFLPDYHAEIAGASSDARTVGTAPYDAKLLPRHMRTHLVWPWLRLTFAGIQVSASAIEQHHFYHATSSARSAGYVAWLVARQIRDFVLYGRSRRLVNGNALVGRLAGTCHDLGVPIWISSPATELIREAGVVSGAVVQRGGTRIRINARRGVVLATGGFSYDHARQRELYPHVRRGAKHYPVGISTNTGDGAHMAEAVGAKFGTDVSNAAAWTPVTPVPNRGATLNLPHQRTYGKPGAIAVTRQGVRFVNDACDYHAMVRAMIKACEKEPEVEAFVVCDHRTLRRYGFGLAVRPQPYPIWPHLRSGYLVRGGTLAELAERAGINRERLVATVERFNIFARQGTDPEFARGETVFDRSQGDPDVKPNPSLGPIEKPPFYALRMVPGDTGTFAGLKTDPFARVLDTSGAPIAGLYAAGNDAESIFAGDYPGGGATIGAGMTFGYVAAMHLAGKEIATLTDDEINR